MCVLSCKLINIILLFFTCMKPQELEVSFVSFSMFGQEQEEKTLDRFFRRGRWRLPCSNRTRVKLCLWFPQKTSLPRIYCDCVLPIEEHFNPQDISLPIFQDIQLLSGI